MSPISDRLAMYDPIDKNLDPLNPRPKGMLQTPDPTFGGKYPSTPTLPPSTPKPIPPSTTPTETVTDTATQQPGPSSTQEFLERFGYMGDMPINPYEKLALDYITKMSEGAPLETLTPAQNFLSSLVGGEFAPQGQAFREAVYQPVEERALTNLERASKGLGERFAHRGGFFGGKHAIAQGEMGERVLSSLSEVLANLNLGGFQGDIANRMGAATGLESMGRTQQAIGGDILSQIMGGGELLTGREGLNRAEEQQAMQRAYQDWIRARQENMMPFNLISTLLGAQPFENIVQQPQQSPWGELLGGIGQGIGQIPGLL